MNKQNYWRDRFEKLEAAQIQDSLEFSKHLLKQYEQSVIKIQKDIEVWYIRLAKNNKISLLEAKKLLSENELKEFQWTVQDYIEKAKDNALSKKWIKELENASSKVHIDRLESLKIQVKSELEQLYTKLNTGMSDELSRVYSTKYYHTAFEVQKGIGIGFDVAKLNESLIINALKNGWTADEKNFSSRIWNNKAKLLNTLKTDLVQSIVRGESPQKVVRLLSKEFEVEKRRIKTLVITETSYISSLAEYECLKDLDVEEYEVVATLDKRTSTKCQNLDGHIFKLTDYEIGTTAPPFHPNCRSTTVPVIGVNFGTRIARDKNGKNKYIHDDMVYKEWERLYAK